MTVDPVAISKVVKGLNQLSIELYKRTPKEGNVVASPLSVATALSVVELGARGESAQALQALFGATDRESHMLGLQGLLQQLRGGGTMVTSENDEELYPYQLSVSSSLWADQTFPLSKRYRKSIASSYRAVANRVDVRNSEDAAAKVNQWVHKATAGKIKTMADASMFGETLRLALLNVVYFRGSWRTPFESVEPAPFHANGTKETSEVNMMTVFDYASSVQNEEVKIVDLVYASPFKEVSFTMTVLLPHKRDGLAKLESGLTLEKLDGWLAEMRSGAVHIAVPMWQTASALDFKKALTELGVGELFGPEANLSGISKKAGLHIGSVTHRAYIEVDRKGTEAAGVTMVMQPRRAAWRSRVSRRPPLSLSHPRHQERRHPLHGPSRRPRARVVAQLYDREQLGTSCYHGCLPRKNEAPWSATLTAGIIVPACLCKSREVRATGHISRVQGTKQSAASLRLQRLFMDWAV